MANIGLIAPTPFRISRFEVPDQNLRLMKNRELLRRVIYTGTMLFFPIAGVGKVNGRTLQPLSLKTTK